MLPQEGGVPNRSPGANDKRVILETMKMAISAVAPIDHVLASFTGNPGRGSWRVSIWPRWF